MATSRILSNLDPGLHRDLSVAALLPPLLWKQTRYQDALPEKTLKRFQGLIVRFRIQGPLDASSIISVLNNDPGVMAVVFNNLYSSIVTALTHAGGMILDMTMDEVVALFPLEGEAQAGLVQRALMSAENAIQAVQESKQHAGNPAIQWQISAGAGLGSVLIAIVGSDDIERKTLLVDGPALYQAAEALNNAQPGQVLAHRDVMKRLGSAPDGRWVNTNFFLPQQGFSAVPVISMMSQKKEKEEDESRFGYVVPGAGTALDYELSLFIDPQLRLAAPFVPLQGGVYARRLAVLVIQMPHFSLVEEKAVERWQKVLESIVEITARYEGLIDRITPEEKHGEIRIMFGIPQLRENVSHQAAGCAMALQQTLKDIEPGVRVSLATHRGFASLVGTTLFSQYVVISPAVEKARELMAYARPLEILADHGIQQSTERLFAWRQIRQNQVPDETEAVYALAGEIHLGRGLRPRHDAARHIPLVGREAEQKQLRHIVEKSLKGEAHLLLITGASGHGRSALVDETINYWLEHEGNGFIAIGSSYAPPAPYSLWIPIWQALFELTLTDKPAVNLEKLGQALSRLLPDMDWATALYASVLGLSTENQPEIAGLAPMARQQRLFNSTLAILKKLAGVRPIMLVFEYLDHTDNHSLELLLQLSDSLKEEPVLFCIEDRGDTRYSMQSLFLSAEVVAARPLSSQEAWQLLRHLVSGVDTFPEAYNQALMKRLGDPDNPDKEPGYVPFDVVALATTLKSVVLKTQGNGWDFESSLSPENWPQDTIEAIDMLLKESLKENETRVATRAAASGMMFYHDSPWIKGKTVAGLIELRRVRELNLCEPYIDEGHLRRWERFRHRLVQETLYSYLGITDRTRRHKMAADWTAEYTPGKAGMITVAHQAEHAGEVQQAVDAYIQASEHAVEWGATSEAMQYLLAAERLITRYQKMIENPPRSLLRISIIKAELYLSQEKIQQGIAEVERALEYTETLKDSLTQGRCLVLLGRFAQPVKNYEAMQRYARQAVALARQSGDAETQAQGLWLQARALYAENDNQEAAHLLKQAIHLSEDSTVNIPLRIEMALDATRILLADYQRDRARQYVERARRYAEQLDDPVMLHQVYTQLGNLYLFYGKSTEALEALETALSLPPPSDATIGNLGNLLISHASALCYSGRYTDAEATFETAGDYFLADSDEISMLEVKIIRAHEFHLDVNGLDEVQSILDEVRLSWSHLSEGIRILARLVQASVHIQRRQFQQAEQALSHVSAMPDSSAVRWFAPLYNLRQAELALARGELKQAIDYAFKTLGAISYMGDLRYLAAAYCVLAEAMILNKADDEAIEDALGRAIKTARDQGRTIHLARAMLLNGYHLRNTSLQHKTRARASTYRFEAAQIYREMGLPMPEKIASYDIETGKKNTRR